MQEFQDGGTRLQGGKGSPPDGENDRAAAPAHHAHAQKRMVDAHGLILPKKLANPCLESREAMDLHREIKWNAKT